MMKVYSPKKIAIVCICLILSFLFEFMSGCRFSEIERISDLSSNMKTIGISELECKDFKANGTTLSSDSNDAYIIIRSVDSYVGYVYIDLNQAVNMQWHCTAYYQNPEHPFSEEYSYKLWISGNSKKIFLPVNDNVQDLRIDLGTEENLVFDIKNIIVNPSIGKYLLYVISEMSFVRVAIYFLVLLCAAAIMTNREKSLPFIFRYRWAIGCVFVITATVLNLNGSSIACLFDFGLPGFDDSNLWGSPRGIRSDEYVVFTQMALSQAEEGFPWLSDVWGYSPRDMGIVFGQTIFNPITLYRPFLLGFLLFGAERGLAFYWSSRLVFGFLVSFEFGRILTKNNNKLSVAYAAMVILAPIVQWWYSVNSIVELLLFGQLAIVLLYNYFLTDKVSKRILYTLGIVLCAGGYIISFYPRWMYPLAYVFLAALVAVIIENKDHIKIGKNDILIWTGGLLILIVSAIFIFQTSEDTIYALNNTYYPGKIKSLGGNIYCFTDLFRSWGSVLFTLLFDGNPCEKTGFFDFFPLGLIFSVIIIFFKKKKDIWLISLNIANLFLMAFILLGFPEWLSTVSLLSGSSAGRTVMAVGFINLMILTRALSLEEMPKWNITASIAAGLLIGKIAVFRYSDNMTPPLEIFVVLFAVTIVLLITQMNKKHLANTFLAISLSLSLVGGGMVNPVNSGLDLIYQNPLLQKIKEINSADKGTWAVCLGENWLLNNIPAIVGAKCINTTSVYPDREMWEKLDMEDQDELWNRYLHMAIALTNEDTLSYKLVNSDLALVYMPLEKLKELGVKYVITNETITFSSNVTLLSDIYGYKFYKLEENTEISDDFRHLANLSDENWTEGVHNSDHSLILFDRSSALYNEITGSKYIVSGGDKYEIINVVSDERWINVWVDRDASGLHYPADISLE